MSLRQRMEVLDVDDGSFNDLPICDSKGRDGKHRVHTLFGVVLLAFLAGLFYLVYFIDGIGPTPLMISDEKKYPDSFIAERAKNILTSLTDLGPRIVGSRINEEVTVALIKRQIEHIQRSADPSQLIELDLQTASGSYYLGYQPKGCINAYANVHNIIVRVKGSSGSGVLVNSHFDSVPTSPGANDDGIMCAAMLEILEKLSKLRERPSHDLIFLFNGAEETMLQASHGFITQHKWAASPKVIVNLDAAGSGHKEILFQSGPKVPWLLRYYNRVPHPYGQAAGEEIFQSNLIPSDTDFRIFRDFGKLVGYDLAFPRNGYRYHTKYDDMKYIPLWSYQHVGDNILSLVKSLSNAPEILSIEDAGEGTIVYFDFFGLFMIAYSQLVAYIINMIVVVLSIVVTVLAFRDFGQGLRWRTLKLVLSIYGFIAAGWVLSVLAFYAIALILDASYRTMSWFTNSWILFGLYAAPIMTITFGSMHLYNYFGKQDNLSVSIQIQIQIHLMRLIWTVILFAGTIAGIRSVYAIMIPILFNIVYFALLKLFRWQYTTKLWQIIYIVSTVIPTMLLMYQSIICAGLFIPITARIGADKNPELLVGAVVTIFTFAITSYYAPLIGMVKKPYITLGALLLSFIITIIFVATPLGFPYNDSSEYPTPQRFFVHHMSRTFRDDNNKVIHEDSGIYFFNLDRNSPHTIRDFVPELAQAESVTPDCEKYLVCGLPLSSPRMLESVKYSTWIPYEKPIYVDPISLKMTSRASVNQSVIRFSFTVTGPDHSSIFFKPRNGSKVKTTSLADVSGPDLIYVSYSQGNLAPLDFTIDIQHPEDYTSGPLIDISISGRYVHHEIDKLNKEFVRFIKSFPSWADVTPTVASFESFVF